MEGSNRQVGRRAQQGAAGACGAAPAGGVPLCVGRRQQALPHAVAPAAMPHGSRPGAVCRSHDAHGAGARRTPPRAASRRHAAPASRTLLPCCPAVRAAHAVQAKDLLARYGSAYLITSISFAIVSVTACYAAVDAGVDVAGLLQRFGLQVGDSGGGRWGRMQAGLAGWACSARERALALAVLSCWCCACRRNMRQACLRRCRAAGGCQPPRLWPHPFRLPACLPACLLRR